MESKLGCEIECINFLKRNELVIRTGTCVSQINGAEMEIMPLDLRFIFGRNSQKLLKWLWILFRGSY